MATTTTKARAAKTTPAGGLTLSEEQTEFTPEQIKVLSTLVGDNADQATAEDWQVLFHQCQRTGLDPFARQIYMIGRNAKAKRGKDWVWVTKFTIQTSIDGFRLVVRRATDLRNGTLSYEGTLWCGPDGRWQDVWLEARPPSAAKVTIVRDGGRFDGVARFDEYAGRTKDGGLSSMWAKLAATMIAKCAESLALRKAFPQDLSGLYTAEEMAQADNPAAAPVARPAQHDQAAATPPTPVPGQCTVQQAEEVREIAARLRIDDATIIKTGTYLYKGTAPAPGHWETWPARSIDVLLDYLRDREQTAQADAAHAAAEASQQTLPLVEDPQTGEILS